MWLLFTRQLTEDALESTVAKLNTESGKKTAWVRSREKIKRTKKTSKTTNKKNTQKTYNNTTNTHKNSKNNQNKKNKKTKINKKQKKQRSQQSSSQPGVVTCFAACSGHFANFVV